jgi:hypothetical protein
MEDGVWSKIPSSTIEGTTVTNESIKSKTLKRFSTLRITKSKEESPNNSKLNQAGLVCFNFVKRLNILKRV